MRAAEGPRADRASGSRPALPRRPSGALLDVRDLTVHIDTPRGVVRAVRAVSLDVFPGETLALLGEAGCGKSTAAMAMVGLRAPSWRVTRGESWWEEIDLLAAGEGELRRVRGRHIGLLFDDAAGALHPAIPVVDQVADAVRASGASRGRAAARRRARQALAAVGLSDPRFLDESTPSARPAGARQRARLAMALAKEPQLIVADEPTRGLDVTVQAQILALLSRQRSNTAVGMLIVTQDVGVVAELADRVAVMYAGQIVEVGPCEDVFEKPRHPYTAALIECGARERAKGRLLTGRPPDLMAPPSGCAFQPRCSLSAGRSGCREVDPVMEVSGAPSRPRAPRHRLGRDHRVACHFTLEMAQRRPPPIGPDQAAPVTLRAPRILEAKSIRYSLPPERRGGAPARVVDGISLVLKRGETLGLVGESSSGKTTLASILAGLASPQSGRIRLDGVEIALDGPRKPDQRRSVQVVLEAPLGSLNPRHSVGRILAQPLRMHGLFRERGGAWRVQQLLEMVDLRADDAGRFPESLTSDEGRRVGLARALALEPQILIVDEPARGLDAVAGARVLELLGRLQRDLALSMLVISDDPSVVRHLADRVVVMYAGRIVEEGSAADIFTRPTHPYTRALLAATPADDPRLRGRRSTVVLEGDPPSARALPPGCRFHPRCRKARDLCRGTDPELETRRIRQSSACHFPEEGELDPRTAPGATLA